MITDKNTIVKINTANTEGKATAFVRAQKQIEKICIKVKEKTGREFSFVYQVSGKETSVAFEIEKPLLWSTYTPNLYAFEMTISYADETESVCGQFGFRTLKTNGKNVTLNGTPIFIRGYIRGIKCHDHKNNCRLSEYEYYKKNLTQAKKFGFNYVRFHSTIPPETLFKAADETGMLIHIELRPEEDEYNNLEEMLFASRDLVSDDFVQGVIDDLYNHPSLAVYCIGNELKALGKPERIVELGAFIKKTDPTRLFVDTCAWGEKDRPNVDFDVQHMSYYFPFGKHANMFDDIKSIHTYEKYFEENDGAEAKMNVPLIAHEVCHYTALRDFENLKEKFEKYGVEKPWWIDEELKMIKAKGLTDLYGEMYKASRDFQGECWKTALEAIRSSEILSGFHFLQFSDTDVYENSNGVVDCFDDINYVTPEFFNVFNGDEILLTELGSRQYKAGQKVHFPIKYSNFGERRERYADFSYLLKNADGEECARGEIKNIDVSRRGLYEIGSVEITLPSKKTGAYELEVRLESEKGALAKNRWKFWAYCVENDYDYERFTRYDQDGVCITSDIQTCLQALETGKKVCLVYRSDWTRHLRNQQMQPPKYALKATWNRFKPVIWDRGTNYGGLCEENVLNKYGFVSDKYYDFNYSQITEDCDKIILDDFPVKVRSIVSGIDKNVRDRFDAYTYAFNLPELQYDRTLRDFSYLFEVGVDKGKLLVCGLNMKGLNENEPSTQAMANCIINYLHSDDFAPKTAISLSALKAYMQECAREPVKERMMTQFWELDDTPVESKEYWIESEKYLKN